jgi:peptidoglycan/LPS O-acetylase OafA/YrhL
LCIFLFPLVGDGLYPLLMVTFVLPLLVFISSGRFADKAFVASIHNWSGRLSYPIYCLHVPVYAAVKTILGGYESISGLRVLILCSIVTLVVSALVVRLYDEPVRKYLTRLSDRDGRDRPRRPNPI